MSMFSGIWIPLITPFADGRVDHAALRKLVEG
jgi:4-hydroxy-tetrahydrodipicolinate synthase